MKRALFYAIAATPLLSLAVAVTYFIIFTNLPQTVYMDSVRNIYFDCMTFVDRPYVYKMKPGRCPLSNIEYEAPLTHDVRGFRNAVVSSDNDIAVLGDSHAQGFGVKDHQTFSSLLSGPSRFRLINLAIASYGTQRELDAMQEYAADAKYVILQYCNNDASENDASLRLSAPEFRTRLETGWKNYIAHYHRGKALGWRYPLADLAGKLFTHAYLSKVTWRNHVNARDIAGEASLFARILDRHRDLLAGRRLIVFESSGWGFNSPNFAAAFGTELSRRDWLTVRVLDTARLLGSDDYYFLDDHLNANGHRKLATMLANEIAAWEKSGARLESPITTDRS